MTVLKESGVEYQKVNYYEEPLSVSKLKELLKKMNVRARDILRDREAIYKKLELDRKKDQMSEDELVGLMIRYPDLIQRPIVERGNRAVLARPTENIHKLL